MAKRSKNFDGNAMNSEIFAEILKCSTRPNSKQAPEESVANFDEVLEVEKEDADELVNSSRPSIILARVTHGVDQRFILPQNLFVFSSYLIMASRPKLSNMTDLAISRVILDVDPQKLHETNFDQISSCLKMAPTSKSSKLADLLVKICSEKLQPGDFPLQLLVL